jgi:hypothetical protein
VNITDARFSNVARNDSWIKASFQNQNDTSSFLTIGTEGNIGINWTSFGTDISSSWQWSFIFPNGPGYYEFYSIGKKSGSVDEVAPGGADAICDYNTAPAIEVITPANESTGVSLQPTCSIWANDTDGDTLTVYWYENTTGDWLLRNTNSSISANSTVNYTFTQFRNYSITYYWKVAVNDGKDNVSAVYHLTTESINTSVDTISPYLVVSSPLTINATGLSSLDNVTLWYRYSALNSTWWNSSWTYRKQLTIDHNQVAENRWRRHNIRLIF